MARDLMKDNLFQRIILTRIPYERMENPDSIRPVFQRYTDAKIDTEESMERACEMALSEKKETDLVYMAGSLYFIGSLKEFFSRERN